MTSEQGVAGKRRRTAAEIEQIVREFQNSGLNRSQFCRQQGLTLGVLNRGLRRLQAGGSCSAESGDRLIAVELASKIRDVEPAGSCGLAVVLGRGRRIAVSTGFDPATLQRLVQVLERM
jgi:transposase-like protein